MLTCSRVLYGTYVYALYADMCNYPTIHQVRAHESHFFNHQSHLLDSCTPHHTRSCGVLLPFLGNHSQFRDVVVCGQDTNVPPNSPPTLCVAAVHNHL